MSFALSYYTDLFAASAGSGAASIPNKEEEVVYQTPRFFVQGHKDNDDASIFAEKTRAWLTEAIENLGLSEVDAYNASYKTGRFHNYVWENEAGVPLLRYTNVEEMAHTSTLEIMNMMYDWLTQFTRAEDGSIVYGGGIYNELQVRPEKK